MEFIFFQDIATSSLLEKIYPCGHQNIFEWSPLFILAFDKLCHMEIFKKNSQDMRNGSSEKLYFILHQLNTSAIAANSSWYKFQEQIINNFQQNVV